MLTSSMTFNGNCPECILHNDGSFDMLLNNDDYWESKQTGLQIAVAPPFAVILPWRGEGDYKVLQAAIPPADLIYCGVCIDDAGNFLPDQSQPILESIQLEAYLEGVYTSWNEWVASSYDLRGRLLHKHEQHLNNFTPPMRMEIKQAILDFLATVSNIDKPSTPDELSSAFQTLRSVFSLYAFAAPFQWMAWPVGLQQLNDRSFLFSNCTLLDLTKYLQVITKSNKLNPETLNHWYNNGQLVKLMSSLADQLS